jgi:phospholipase/carboxylesterase
MPRKEPDLIDSGPLLTELGMVHKVLEPAGAGPYRTVVMLHGRFGDEDMMWVFRRSTPAHWLKITPRGLLADENGVYSWISQKYGEWPDLAAFDAASTAVARFLEALPRVYNADPDHIYLMGFSQGAALSYATAMRNPGLVRAIAGLVGFMPEACDNPDILAPLEELPIFMAVGLEDKLVPHERSLGCADVLRQANAQLSYNEYNTGHKLNARGMSDLHEWWYQRELS